MLISEGLAVSVPGEGFLFITDTIPFVRVQVGILMNTFHLTAFSANRREIACRAAVIVTCTVAACVLSLSPLSARAQDLKIGYVDRERVRVESLPAKTIEAKLHAEFSKRETELGEQEARLRAAAEELDKIAPTLPESERGRRQRELLEQDRNLARKRREFNEDFAQRVNEERAGLDSQAYIAIRRIFREEKYDLILQDALLVGPKVDITNQVIKALGTTGPPAK